MADNKTKTHEKIAVLADMLELGEHADELHYSVGCFVKECEIDLLFVVGKLSLQTAKGAIDSGMSSDDVFIFDNNEGLIEKLKTVLNEDDVMLVKGSRSMRMEEVVKGFV